MTAMALALAWSFSTAGRALAQTGPKKPKVPPGLDPGGVAVVIIGAGVNYRLPEIAQRLARDGEGEPIAWDIIDDDPRPLETALAPDRRVAPFAGTEPARLLLAEAGASRLVPVRIPDDNAGALGAALAFASRSPARVVIALTVPRDASWSLFENVARHARQLIVIMPAGEQQRGGRAAWRETRGPDSLIIVSAVHDDGRAITSAGQAGGRADVAIPLAAVELPAELTGDAVIAAENTAAVRLGALAARLAAVAPDLDGAALKARLLSYAEPLPKGSAATPMAGWIKDVGRIHRGQ